MNSFHRTKRNSGPGVFIGLSIVCVLSVVFMLLGFANIEDLSGIKVTPLIIGLVGVALFVAFLRGCWLHLGGPITHVFSITDAEVEWGVMGREKKLPMDQIAEVYWDERDGFTLLLIRHRERTSSCIQG